MNGFLNLRGHRARAAIVPTFQHGNVILDTPASRVLYSMLERRGMHSHTGAWGRKFSFFYALLSAFIRIHLQLKKLIWLILPLLLLTACGEEKNTGSGEVRWDREICARCAMAVSDPKYSAQVRGGKPEKKTKLYKFDDLGCAVIWLGEQNWKDAPRTEIWVNDYYSGKWINAETAWYVKMNNTPMDYGLGAQVEQVEAALNYEQAKVHIYKVEERFNAHTGLPISEPSPEPFGAAQ